MRSGQVRSEAVTLTYADGYPGWVPQCHRLRDPRKPLRLQRGMGTTADLGESNGTRPGHHRSEQKREPHRRRTSPSSPRRGKGISPFFPILPSSRGGGGLDMGGGRFCFTTSQMSPKQEENTRSSFHHLSHRKKISLAVEHRGPPQLKLLCRCEDAPGFWRTMWHRKKLPLPPAKSTDGECHDKQKQRHA